MASASPDNIKQWKFPDGNFTQNMSGHNSIINTLALNQDNVLVSGGRLDMHMEKMHIQTSLYLSSRFSPVSLRVSVREKHDNIFTPWCLQPFNMTPGPSTGNEFILLTSGGSSSD